MDPVGATTLLPFWRASPPPSLEGDARIAAKNFEAFFLQTVLEDILPEANNDAFGGGSNAENIWRSQLNEQYANLLAERGGVGIADMVMRELINNQSAQLPAQRPAQLPAQRPAEETSP